SCSGARGQKCRTVATFMKAGNCDQFALIETDQRCIDHVFYRHDDLRGHLCHGKPATSQPSVAVLPGDTTWTRMPLLVSSCCSESMSVTTGLDMAMSLVSPRAKLNIET